MVAGLFFFFFFWVVSFRSLIERKMGLFFETVRSLQELVAVVGAMVILPALSSCRSLVVSALVGWSVHP